MSVSAIVGISLRCFSSAGVRLSVIVVWTVILPNWRVKVGARVLNILGIRCIGYEGIRGTQSHLSKGITNKT